MRRSYLFIVVIVLLGGLFRFANLSGKVYWHDEAYTALYATGHSSSEATALFDGQIRTAADLLALQIVTPERGIGETVRQLAENDAHHPPFYYALTRLMMYGIDNTVFATRLVAAIAGLLLIPAIYWFGLELFSAPFTASLSAALVAVSPFHYLYAQEAREYSLWALTIALSSGALLRALRKNSLFAWFIYAATLTAGLYGCILTFLVMASHSLYVLYQTLIGHSRSWKADSRILRNFALSLLGSLLLFAPWLKVLLNVNVSAVSWTAKPMPIVTLARIWASNLSRLFFDVNLDVTSPLIYTVIPVLISTGLIAYTLLWSIKHLPKSALLFLGLLGGITLLAFVGPDLVLGGRRSSVSRYLVPVYLSLQLAVAAMLSQKLSVRRVWPSWRMATLGLLTVGVLSCAVSIPADTWWNKKYSHLNPGVAQVINRATNSLLVSSDNNINKGEILSLAHGLRPNQPVLLFSEPEVPAIPDGVNTIFLFNLSQQVQAQLDESSAYEVAAAYEAGRLWQLKPKNALKAP